MTRRRRPAPVRIADIIDTSARNAAQESAALPTPPAPAPHPPAEAQTERQTPTKRRRRSSVGGFVSKLDAPLREGETRRWVNDDGNRIAEVRELGYEFVSDKGVQTNDPGSRISRLVGTKANGEPLHAYLMETPDELYAQGVDDQEASNRLIDEAITAGRDSTGRMDEHQYGQGSIKVGR